MRTNDKSEKQFIPGSRHVWSSEITFSLSPVLCTSPLESEKEPRDAGIKVKFTLIRISGKTIPTRCSVSPAIAGSISPGWYLGNGQCPFSTNLTKQDDIPGLLWRSSFSSNQHIGMHLRESTHFTRINTLEVLRGSDTTSTSVIEGYSVEATYRWKAGKSHRSYFNSGTTRIPILLSSIPFIVYLLENSFSWQQRPGRPVKLLPGRQNYVCSVLSENHSILDAGIRVDPTSIQKGTKTSNRRKWKSWRRGSGS